MYKTEEGYNTIKSFELIERKNLTIIPLKEALNDKQEVKDGYAYTFSGSEHILNEICTFIQFARTNFPFLKFEMTAQDLKSHIRLKITGPDGAKEFLHKEINI